MNKLDPFDGDEEGSDGEVVPSTSVYEQVNLPQQPQDQVHHTYNPGISNCPLSIT